VEKKFGRGAISPGHCDAKLKISLPAHDSAYPAIGGIFGNLASAGFM